VDEVRSAIADPAAGGEVLFECRAAQQVPAQRVDFVLKLVSCSVTTASDDGACFSSLVPGLGHDLAVGESTGRLPVSIELMPVRVAGRRPL
jgi:hypothetical protein